MSKPKFSYILSLLLPGAMLFVLVPLTLAYTSPLPGWCKASLTSGKTVAIDRTKVASIPVAETSTPENKDGNQTTAFVHHRWEKAGRTLYNHDTGQYMYVSYIGQTSVDLGDGDYAPYVWDPVAKIARFADCELRFFNPHFEFWRNREELTTAKFRLLKKVGTDWVNIPVLFHSLTVNEGDEYAIATLKLGDTNGNEITTNIRFGQFHYINLDFEVKVDAEGEYRLEMENAGLSGDVREIHSGKGIDGKREDRVIGVVYEKMRFGWSYDEAPDRLYLHEVQTDGSETSRKIVKLGNLSPGKPKLISPDQWGPIAIAVDEDDGEENGRVGGTHEWVPDGYYPADNSLFLGYYSGYNVPFEIAWRWDNIEASGTANDGCKIEAWHNVGHSEQGTSDNTTLYGIDEADPDAFSASRFPSDQPRTTANVAWNPVIETVDADHEKATSPEIKTIIQELLNDYTYTGTQAMAIYWRVDSTNQWYRNYDDYGLTPAQLTIVYTPPTWESYKEAAHTTVWGTESNPYDDTTQTVYMFGQGFDASQLYHVGFYDPSPTPNKVGSDSSNSTATGNLSALYLLTHDPSAQEGWWHAVVYKDPDSPPISYNATDPNAVADDDFKVLASAIPEFPTVIAAIVVVGSCFGIYWWMRKRRLRHVKA